MFILFYLIGQLSSNWRRFVLVTHGRRTRYQIEQAELRHDTSSFQAWYTLRKEYAQQFCIFHFRIATSIPAINSEKLVSSLPPSYNKAALLTSSFKARTLLVNVMRWHARNLLFGRESSCSAVNYMFLFKPTNLEFMWSFSFHVCGYCLWTNLQAPLQVDDFIAYKRLSKKHSTMSK